MSPLRVGQALLPVLLVALFVAAVFALRSDTMRVPPLTPAAVAGRTVTQKYVCVDCHTILGKGGTYGPDLTEAWSRFLVRSGGNEAVARSSMMAFLQHPSNATIDRRLMPNLKITPAEASALVDFLRWTSRR
jgi:nitric oxide reductase subunit C